MFLVGVLQHSQQFFSYEGRRLGLTQYQMDTTLPQLEPAPVNQSPQVKRSTTVMGSPIMGELW